MADATRGSNPHRDALVQLARWAQQRYEDLAARLRTSVDDDAVRLGAMVHDLAQTVGMARGWLDVADRAGDEPLPAGLLLAAPAADAIFAVEADNAELRRLLESYRHAGATGGGC